MTRAITTLISKFAFVSLPPFEHQLQSLLCTGCLLGEVCSFRSEPWDPAALRGRQPPAPLRHQQLRGDPRPAASPSLRVARSLPSARKTSPAGRAVAVLSAGRHGRGARRGGNLVRGFHAA